MSGGSYDYLYYKVEDAAMRLCNKSEPAYRRAFGVLLKKVAQALHDIEWVDSSDLGAGDDETSIMLCISNSDVLACTVADAERIKEELEEAIKIAKKGKNE